MTDALKKYIFLGFASIAMAIYIFIESQGNGDLFIYLSASNDLFDDINIFEKKYVDGYHYFYSVLFAVVLKPLTYLPLQIANLVWLSLNLFLVVRIFMLIKNMLPLHDFTKKELLILFLSLQGMRLVFSNKPRPFWGALLIALGINIKLLPIVLVPYLFYRGFFKAGAYVILIYAGLLLLPALVIGWEQNQLLLNTWSGLINPFNSNHVLDTEERSFHGLSTLLSTLLMQNSGDVYALNIKRNIADVSIEQLNIVLNIVRGLLVVFTIYFLRSKPFQSNVGLKHRFWELSYILLLIPLIFPHQQHYAFLFICPAFIFCLYHFIQNRKTFSKRKYYFMLASGIVIYLLCNLKIVLGAYNEYYEHFKILTYGALFLLVLLSVCVPKENTVTSTA